MDSISSTMSLWRQSLPYSSHTSIWSRFYWTTAMSFLAFMIPWKDEPLFMPFPLQLSFRDRTASSIPFFEANNQGDHSSLLIFLAWKSCFWNHGFPPFEFLGAVCWEVAGPKRWCLFLHLAEKYPRRCSGEFLPHQLTQRMANGIVT